VTDAGRRLRSAAPAVILLSVPAAFLGVLLLWPLAVVGWRAVAPNGQPDLAALGDALTGGGITAVVWFSAWQAAVSTVLTVMVALPAAWLFARVEFAGRQLLWAALVVPFVLPTVVVAAAVTGLLGGTVQLRGSLAAVLVAHVFFNYAVVVRIVGVAWAALGRRPAEAAAVLGARPWTAFWRVTAPLLAPSVLAAASVVYLFCFTSFGVVLLLGGGRWRTVEVEIYDRVRTLDLTGAALLAVVQLAIVGVLLVVAGRVAQRWSVALPPAGEVLRPAVGWRQRSAVVAVLASMAIIVGAPLAALMWRSVSTPSGVGLVYWSRLGERRGVLTAAPLEALRNSLVVAGVAMAIALVVGGMAVAGIVAIERRRARSVGTPGGGAGERASRRSLAAFDALLMLPLGASAVTVALGFLLALNRPPIDLRGSVALVPLAQALVALPFVVRILLPAARAIDRRVHDAAAVLGAGPWRVLWEVDRPALARPVAVAAGFALAVSLGEFGATVVLARPDLPTLPLVVGRLLGQPGELNRGQAMAVATLLMAVTAAVVLAADRLRLGRAKDG
jgi:thiamine transport system permease protein